MRNGYATVYFNEEFCHVVVEGLIQDDCLLLKDEVWYEDDGGGECIGWSITPEHSLFRFKEQGWKYGWNLYDEDFIRIDYKGNQLIGEM